MLRAWRLLSAQPSLQRLPRRIGGGPAAVRSLTVTDPGPVRKLVDSSEDNPKSAEELGKQRTLMLGRLLKVGDANTAWDMFEGLLADGHASEHHLTTMLKACATSNKQRALVSRVEEAGVATAVRTYNFLLDSLRVEGRAEEVEALQQEMERRGIEPNEQTAQVLTCRLPRTTLSPPPCPDPSPNPNLSSAPMAHTHTLCLTLTLTLTLPLPSPYPRRTGTGQVFGGAEQAAHGQARQEM